MAASLAAYLQQLRVAREEGVELEPAIDDRNIEGLEDGAALREQEDLEAGAVLKGVVEPGEAGAGSPGDGDLVFLHYSLRNSQEEVVASTFLAEGGSGRPAPFLLGKGARMLRGLELAVKDMKRGERAAISIAPHYAFKHPDCRAPLPEGLRRDEPVAAEAVLANWYPSRGVRAVGEAGDVYRRNLVAAEGQWETPRPPFEATFHLELRMPTTTGRQGEGRAYWSTGGAPLTAALGSGQLPPAVEAALGSMVRGDEAVVACPAAALRGGALVPDPPPEVGNGGSEGGGPQSRSAGDWLEFTVRLVDFLQVRDLTGDGQAMKRTVSKGRGDFPVDCPIEDSNVRVHYRVRAAAAGGSAAGPWVYDTRWPSGADASSSGVEEAGPAEFDTGMGAVPDAIDAAVRLMLRGETALVTASWAHAYAGREGEAPTGLEPGAPVDFEICLVDFEGEPNREEMGTGDKLARAQRWKEQGNMLFKQARARGGGWEGIAPRAAPVLARSTRGKYQLARVKYHKALKWANQVTAPETQEQADAALAARLAALTNLAACAQRQAEFGEAVGWCNKALEIDPEHAKAYFRRAAALAQLGEYKAAADDLAIADCDRETQRMAAMRRQAEEKQRRDLRAFLDRSG
eukprot:scaffold4.g4741.t1